MKLVYSVFGLLLSLSASATTAAQLTERPLPPTRPVGIIYQTEVGRTTANTLKDDELAQAAVAEVEQTLRRLGYQVVSRAEVIQRLIEAGIDCPSGVQNCAPVDVLKTLELGAVVLVALWWDRAPADITVEVTSTDAVGVAKGKLDADVGQRVPELVTAALADLKNGRAVEVGIYSVPIGAEVRLDGEVLGTTPVNAKARPGAHEVIVSYPEYVTTSQHFDVPRGADGPQRVDVTMERTTASAARTAPVPLPPPTQAAPTWDYVLGAGLGALGAVLLVNPILTLASEGECDNGSNDVGCEQVHFGARTGVQLAGGVLALSGSVIFFATTPIAAAVSTDGEMIHAQLHGSF